MDSHYDQVMTARDAAGQGSKRYFAYSTALDAEAFDQWKNQHGYDFFSLPEGEIAEAVDLELVFDFPSRFWGGRVAGLRAAKGKSVFGRVFEITEKDWPIIQHKEGVVTHMCEETPVKLKVGGKTVDAVAFTTRKERQNTDGPVSAPFVEALVRGARSAGLPEAWLAQITQAAR